MRIRLRCYNQYPGLYQNIESMTQDLKRIHDLGFDQVWINPIYTPCQTNPIPGMEHRIHSPYGMQSEQISPRYATNDTQVRAYTKTAVDLGMTPIFDLVGRHVAIDHRFVKGDEKLLVEHQIDSSRWFKRHANGNLIMHNMDENYNPTSENPWCDIACFNYDDPVITDEIFKYFWEPFLRYNLVDLGFKGLRLDAPLMVPPHVIKRLVDIAKGLCQTHHNEEPIVLAETVGIADRETNLGLKGLITHPMNSVYWMAGPEGTQEHSYDEWRQDHNWYTDNKGMLQLVGATVGYAGSHDEPRYIQALLKAGCTDMKNVILRVKEKLAVAALSSDGGWILLYGDEFGVEEKVDLFQPIPNEYHANKELQRFDLSEFVKGINKTLKLMPEPTFPEWQQRVFLDSFPEAVIFLTHQGDGFSGKTYLTIANISEEKKFTLSEEILQEIMLANGRNQAENLRDRLPERIFLCGENFEVKQSLLSKHSDISICYGSPRGEKGMEKTAVKPSTLDCSLFQSLSAKLSSAEIDSPSVITPGS